ncbi:MAG TPA: general stress protein [Gemmatimonadales bacterium]|nr:general stress protein [Gemmatimonadales bacterium]
MAFDSANRTGRTVVGLFRNRADAEQAISDLKDAGFTRQQIGIAIKDRGEQREVADTTDTSPAKGAAAGAVTGGLVGGIIGLLGSLLVPGLGPIVVGGVLESVLVGAGAGAATGGIIGALVGLGVSEEDARHFDAGFREGGTLVTVDAGARVSEAERILGTCNGDLGPSWATRSSRVAGSETPVAPPARRASDKVRATAYNGGERRRYQDPQYTGPERRLVSV